MARHLYIDENDIAHEIGTTAGSVSGSFFMPVDVSISFAASDEIIAIILPKGVSKLYIFKDYTDVAATITLNISPPSGSATVVPESAPGLDVSAWGEEPVIFTVSGMDENATIALFGLRLV